MPRVLCNYSEVFVQLKTNRKHIYNITHTTKIEDSKVLSKFEKIHLIFGTQLLRSGTQLLLDNVPPGMDLELLLWVPRHF